ncbi:hypothetical protein M0R04_09365 [Candidatus Dojkabacteria bacterium]|jgi:hypothetical protein|nr:hypothetical protein [Candidatus Dojkabacteria bacterium]
MKKMNPGDYKCPCCNKIIKRAEIVQYFNNKKAIEKWTGTEKDTPVFISLWNTRNMIRNFLVYDLMRQRRRYWLRREYNNLLIWKTLQEQKQEQKKEELKQLYRYQLLQCLKGRLHKLEAIFSREDNKKAQKLLIIKRRLKLWQSKDKQTPAVKTNIKTLLRYIKKEEKKHAVSSL